MRKAALFLFILVLAGSGLQAQQPYDKVHYGDTVNQEGALQLGELLDKIQAQQETLPFQQKVTGEVQAVCQKKGCWMKMQRPDGKAMRITFKDYGFFVPKDLAGRRVVMEGKIYHDTVSVKVRRHFARDEGKSEEAVMQIDEPTTRLAFKANGVTILP